jgi:hypothetical protein
MAGDWEGTVAAKAVCDRQPCIDDAMEWARAYTHQEPTYTPYSAEKLARFKAHRRAARNANGGKP